MPIAERMCGLLRCGPGRARAAMGSVAQRGDAGRRSWNPPVPAAVQCAADMCAQPVCCRPCILRSPPLAMPRYRKPARLEGCSWHLPHMQVLDDLGGARRVLDTGVQSQVQGADAVGTTGGAEGGDSAQTEQTDLRQKSADIVCALNFGLCLLHTPQAALAYLRSVAAIMQR